MRLLNLSCAILAMMVIVGCGPSPHVPAPDMASPVAVPSDAAAVTIPAGWVTFTGQQCTYEISYPPEMEVTDQNAYSHLISVQRADSDAGTPNFIYISVIPPEIREKVEAGTYMADVYNYDPAAAETLMDMQVGESKSAHQAPAMESGFTYQRLPDATLGGITVMAYENAQPWEFPPGTKEMRYHAALDDCTYLIGGYMDTTGSDQPGAITEDLFQQIMATVRLAP